MRASIIGALALASVISFAQSSTIRGTMPNGGARKTTFYNPDWAC